MNIEEQKAFLLNNLNKLNYINEEELKSKDQIDEIKLTKTDIVNYLDELKNDSNANIDLRKLYDIKIVVNKYSNYIMKYYKP